MPPKLPGQFTTRFNAIVTEPSPRQAQGADGRQLHQWHEAGSMEHTTTYNGVLTRLDGQWMLELQWVDVQNQGHRVILPHKVVQAIRSGYERVINQSNSEGARKAALTRREAGLVPFQPKNKQQRDFGYPVMGG